MFFLFFLACWLRPVESWSQREATPRVVIFPTSQYILYRGLDNPVEIVAHGYACTDLFVSVSNAETAQSGCMLLTQPGRARNCEIVVRALRGTDTVEIARQRCLVKAAPQPTAYFARKSGCCDTIAWETLVAARGVLAKVLDFAFDYRFEVLSFRMTAIDRAGNQYRMVSQSNRVPAEFKAVCEKLSEGGTVQVTEIRVRAPDGERTVSGISLAIRPKK